MDGTPLLMTDFGADANDDDGWTQLALGRLEDRDWSGMLHLAAMAAPLRAIKDKD